MPIKKTAEEGIGAIIEQIKPLFDAKLAFLEKMQTQRLSSQEQIEKNKVDLEYAKLEAGITKDKDQLDWEKEKYKMGLDYGLNINQMNNANLINLEKMKQGGSNYRAELEAETQRRGQNVDIFKTAMSSAGTKVEYDEYGNKKSVSDNRFAEEMVPKAAKAVGFGPRTVGQAEVDRVVTAMAGMTPQQQVAYGSTLRASDPDLYNSFKAFSPQAAPVTSVPAPAPQPQVSGKQDQNPYVQPAIANQGTPVPPVKQQPPKPPMSIGSMNSGVIPQNGDVFLATGGQPSARKKMNLQYDPLGILSN